MPSNPPQKLDAARQSQTKGKRIPWSNEMEISVVRQVARSAYREVSERLGVSRGKLYSTIKKHRAIYHRERLAIKCASAAATHPASGARTVTSATPGHYCTYNGPCPWLVEIAPAPTPPPASPS